MKKFPLFACCLLLAFVSSCRTPRREPARPVLLLLEGAETEWVALSAETRNAFAEYVRIEKASVDEIVKRPEVLDSVIGFLCADPSTLEPIRYLSFDSVYKTNPDIPLHLFRRKTQADAVEHLRPFFTHLESLSPRIGWEPPLSWDEMKHITYIMGR